MNVVIFSGAGFCVPLGLPITNGFSDLLSSSNGNIMAPLNQFLGEQKHDIEHILSTLETFIKDDNFINFLIKDYVSFKGRQEFISVSNDINQIKEHATNLIKEIKLTIYNKLEIYDTKECALLYLNLIRQIKQLVPNSNISFFTTNYDLTFENAISDSESEFEQMGIKGFEFGFRYDKSNSFVFDNTKDYTWNESILEYKKLHGSLDWSISRNKCFKSGAVTTPQEPNKMPVLYPGYKETPTMDPFKTLHDQLLQRLLTAQLVYVIGFAFRDAYINNIFDTALKINKSLEIYCFNPSDLTNLPKESGIKSFVKNYPAKFHHIKSGLTLDENPLDFNSIKRK